MEGVVQLCVRPAVSGYATIPHTTPASARAYPQVAAAHAFLEGEMANALTVRRSTAGPGRKPSNRRSHASRQEWSEREEPDFGTDIPGFRSGS